MITYSDGSTRHYSASNMTKAPLPLQESIVECTGPVHVQLNRGKRMILYLEVLNTMLRTICRHERSSYESSLNEVARSDFANSELPFDQHQAHMICSEVTRTLAGPSQ